MSSSPFAMSRPPVRSQTPTVVRVAAAALPTAWGEFEILGYRSLTSSEEFVAVTKGDLRCELPVLVRIHSQCLTGDVFGSSRCDCGSQVGRALQLIAEAGQGALVYQFQDGRGIGTINKIRSYALQDAGADTVEANERLGFPPDLRDYRQCVEIFLDLGIRRVRVLTNNPRKLAAFHDTEIEVAGRVPLQVEPSHQSIDYLRTKVRKMGHLIDL